jgi:hypothetical protein
MPPIDTSLSKRDRMIDIGAAVIFTLLLLYSVADWLGVLPGERGFQPLRMVALAAALLLQALASLVRPRSRLWFFALLAASAALLGASFNVSR